MWKRNLKIWNEEGFERYVTFSKWGQFKNNVSSINLNYFLLMVVTIFDFQMIIRLLNLLLVSVEINVWITRLLVVNILDDKIFFSIVSLLTWDGLITTPLVVSTTIVWVYTCTLMPQIVCIHEHFTFITLINSYANVNSPARRTRTKNIFTVMSDMGWEESFIHQNALASENLQLHPWQLVSSTHWTWRLSMA